MFARTQVYCFTLFFNIYRICRCLFYICIVKYYDIYTNILIFIIINILLYFIITLSYFPLQNQYKAAKKGYKESISKTLGK